MSAICNCGAGQLGTPHQPWCAWLSGGLGRYTWTLPGTYVASKVDLSDETIEKLAAAIARHLALYETEK